MIQEIILSFRNRFTFGAGHFISFLVHILRCVIKSMNFIFSPQRFGQSFSWVSNNLLTIRLGWKLTFSCLYIGQVFVWTWLRHRHCSQKILPQHCVSTASLGKLRQMEHSTMLFIFPLTWAAVMEFSPVTCEEWWNRLLYGHWFGKKLDRVTYKIQGNVTIQHGSYTVRQSISEVSLAWSGGSVGHINWSENMKVASFRQHELNRVYPLNLLNI
jgi:hypothetical protein